MCVSNREIDSYKGSVNLAKEKQNLTSLDFLKFVCSKLKQTRVLTYQLHDYGM
jgi:hypothetical protein